MKQTKAAEQRSGPDMNDAAREARREYLRGRIARLTDAVDHFDTAKAALLKVCEIVEDLNNVNPDLYYTAREILRKS